MIIKSCSLTHVDHITGSGKWQHYCNINRFLDQHVKLKKLKWKLNYDLWTAILVFKLHDEFNLLNIKDITKHKIATFDGYFETLTSKHNRNTRNGSNFIKIQNYASNFAASSIKIQGAKVWNNLNNNLKSIVKVKTFRIKLKFSCFPYERVQVP